MSKATSGMHYHGSENAPTEMACLICGCSVPTTKGTMKISEQTDVTKFQPPLRAIGNAILCPKPECEKRLLQRVQIVPRTMFADGTYNGEAPSQRHSPTSIAAAEGIKPRTETLRTMVYGLLLAHPGGLTDEEIARRLNLNPNTARPRRIELTARGMVMDSGVLGVTASGRSAVVWQAVPPTEVATE